MIFDIDVLIWYFLGKQKAREFATANHKCFKKITGLEVRKFVPWARYQFPGSMRRNGFNNVPFGPRMRGCANWNA
jgi:hypothetical protein